MLKKLISIILLLALVNTVSAGVSPSEIAIDMIAGDTIAENLTIQGTPGTYMIESKVTPSSVGIKITYSENPIILATNSKNITMYIESDPRLEPNTYYITSIIYQLKESEEKIIYKTRTKTVEKILELEKEIEFLESKLENITILLENQKELCNDTIIQLEQDKEDLENYIAKLKEYILKFENEDDIDENSHFLVWLIIVLIFILFLSIAIVWLWNKNKNKKR